MKKIILLLIFIISLGSLKASHLAGAEISYKYIGDSTGIPFQYLVSLQIYRDLGGIALNTTTQELCVSSSCGANQTYIFDFNPVSVANGGNSRQALPVPGLTECVDPNDPDLVFTEIYFFTKVVTLSGKCADWKFSWHDNARNVAAIDNLDFGMETDLYVDAVLNNMLGPNSSPVFINPAAKSFCVGSPFVWSQAALEPDGDSLYYDFGNPLVSPAFPACITPSNANFATGYSVFQPMTTTSGITIDHRNGTFRFTPAQVENDVVNVIVREYRLDSLTYTWRLIGNTVRDLQIPIVASCKASALAGPRIDPAGSTIECIDRDSLKSYGFHKITNDSTANSTDYCYEIPVVPYNCFDKHVTLRFDIEVLCESLTETGSEFRIVGPDSVSRPVVGVTKNCQRDLTTKEIELVLHKPLDVNGDYFLYVKPGSDQNTLTNRCGFELEAYYMIIIRVTNCPTPAYELKNVTVNLDREIDIHWEADTSTIEASVFTSWNIWRANENNQFYLLTSIDGPGAVNQRTFKDNTLQSSDVDNSQYQYRVQLVQNYNALPPSNFIHAILLKENLINKNGAVYQWTKYDGWDDAAYEFQAGKVNTANQQIAWKTYGALKPDYFEEEFHFPKCTETSDSSGLYAFRVLARDVLNPANNYISESNWLYYKVECEATEEKPTTHIPTVFSPNGDNQNDAFTIRTDYEQAEVSIFNRWGKAVFNSSGAASEIAWDGTDQGSGQKVADGVYYYIISLSGELNDGTGEKQWQEEEKTGALTIFSSGTK